MRVSERLEAIGTAMRRYFILNIIVPLVVGALIYYVLFPDIIFVKTIDELIGVSFHVPVKFSNIFIRYLRYYLLDLLWAYSLMSLVSMMFKDSKAIYAISFVFIIAMEMIQMLPGIPGTFDVIDIVVEMIAGLIAIRINKRRENYEKN